jgi:hypothetical protein
MSDVPEGMLKIEPFIKLYKCSECSEIFSQNDEFVKNSVKTVPLAFLAYEITVAKCPECGHWGSL